MAHWSEPAGCTSPRGWWYDGAVNVYGEPVSLGWYLDYGPRNYRAGHEFCRPDDQCAACQPGNVLAQAILRNDRGEVVRASSGWCQTIAEARSFVELRGRVLSLRAV